MGFQIYPDFGAIVCVAMQLRFEANQPTHVCARRCVMQMRGIDDLDGVLRDCLGTCVYNVEYDAIVCRIFEKEVLRGQVRPVSCGGRCTPCLIIHAHFCRWCRSAK